MKQESLEMFLECHTFPSHTPSAIKNFVKIRQLFLVILLTDRQTDEGGGDNLTHLG